MSHTNEVSRVGQVGSGSSAAPSVNTSSLGSASSRATGGASQVGGGGELAGGDSISFSQDEDEDFASSPIQFAQAADHLVGKPLSELLDGAQVSPGIVPKNRDLPPQGTGRQPVKDNYTGETPPIFKERNSPGIVPRNRDLPVGGRKPVKDNFTGE